MKCARRFTGIAGLVLALAASALCPLVLAQDSSAPPAPPPGRHGFHGGPMSDDLMRFVGFEAGLGGKTVTGAPFTASFSTTQTQSLSDGNVINRSTNGSLARDSEGRTRRDMTLSGIGRFAESGQSTTHHVVFINDVVAGTQYILQPDQKTARQSARPKWAGRGRGADADAAEAQNRPNVTTTSLGTQTINGVQAEGTRVTRTIPAGAIGNEKPIVMTTERWYSPDLQTYVLIKRSDPYVGQTEFQLTNIQRQEPDSSLFQVPADYTVRNGGGRHNRVAPGASPDGAAPPQE